MYTVRQRHIAHYAAALLHKATSPQVRFYAQQWVGPDGFILFRGIGIVDKSIPISQCSFCARGLLKYCLTWEQHELLVPILNDASVMSLNDKYGLSFYAIGNVILETVDGQ